MPGFEARYFQNDQYAEVFILVQDYRDITAIADSSVG